MIASPVVIIKGTIYCRRSETQLGLAREFPRLRAGELDGQVHRGLRQQLAQIAPLGGIAWMEKLTREQRQELGRLGNKARWKHKRKLTPRV